MKNKTSQQDMLKLIHKIELVEMAEYLVTFLKYWASDDKQITRYLPAQELKAKMDISLGENGCTLDKLTGHIQQYLDYTPDAGHPQYNKLLYSGIDPIAVLGDWLASATNSTMHTYKMAPVATLMEAEVIKKLNVLIGFSDGDGIMVSGGTMANMVGMMLARYKLCPDIKEKGLSSQLPLVAYVSELSHYSYQKGANLLGIGTENLIPIKADDQGQMDMAELEGKIAESRAQGKLPFFIGLTAGTTVLGAFDDVAKGADVARNINCGYISMALGVAPLYSVRRLIMY